MLYSGGAQDISFEIVESSREEDQVGAGEVVFILEYFYYSFCTMAIIALGLSYYNYPVP